jgi:hypothetical protein
MSADTVITFPDTAVMFVAGEAGQPIPEQAPKAFAALEARLPSLKRRRFFGVVQGDHYRACVALEPGDDPRNLPLPAWRLPGGKYVRRRIVNWEQHLDLIGPTFEALYKRTDVDGSRPGIEFYRSQRELLVMVPVR